jgi:tetratricopeptide (TPR) repeat protein
MRKIGAFAGLLLLFLTACSSDPKVARQKYLDGGNKYFKNGSYKEASLMYRNAIRKDLKFGEAYYRLGLAELRLGRVAEAVRALQRAVELEKTNQDAHAKLAEIYLAAYSTDQRKSPQFLKEIDNLSKTILELNPSSFDGLRLRGYLNLANKDLKGAIENFEKAAKIKPMDPSLTLALVQAINADGRAEEAEKMALALLEKEKSYGPMYDVLFVDYMRKNRPQDAENLLLKKVANNPKNPNFLLQQAAFFQATRRPDQMQASLQKLVSDGTTFPNGPQFAGDFYFRIRDFEKAQQTYELGLQRDPKNKLVYQKRIVEALLFQNKRTEASNLLEKVVKEAPDDNEARAMRGSMMLQAGTPDQVNQAVQDLQTAVNKDPRNAVLQFNLARAHIARNDFEQARVRLQDAIRYRPDYLLPRLALAQLFIQKNDFNNALLAANQTLEFDKNNAAALLLRSSAQIGLKDFDKAKEDLDRVMAQNPNITDAIFQMGLIHYAKGDLKSAETQFRRLYEVSPQDPRAIRSVIDILTRQNRFDEAAAIVQKELAKTPDRKDLRLAIANAAYQVGRVDMALGEFQTLLKSNPNDAIMHLRVGEAFRRKEDINSAVGHFEQAAKLAPTNPLPFLYLGMVQASRGDYSKARPNYENALKIDPDNAVVLNNLAFILADNGAELDTALSYAQKAAQKLPKSSEVADTLGWIYIKKNQPDAAIQIFRDLTGREPANPTYQFHLAMALFQKGDRPGAKFACEKALANKPIPAEVSKIKELMTRIG